MFEIHELWKYFVCNTWIMKPWNICLQYMNYEICKYCTLETLGLWKYKKFYLTHELWKN